MTDMATRLEFDMDRAVSICKHSREADKHMASFEQRAEIYGEDNMLEPQPGEEDRVDACFWLVKDRGVYLMSPGIPHQRIDTEHATRFVAYADGYDPHTGDFDDVYDRAQAVSRDDFAIDLPLEWIEQARARNAGKFVLAVDREGVAVVLPPETPRQRTPPRGRKPSDGAEL